MKEIKERIVEIINSNHGIRHDVLTAQLAVEFISSKPNEIMQAVSEASQDGLIYKIEYRTPDKQFRSFYIPAGSKIVS